MGDSGKSHQVIPVGGLLWGSSEEQEPLGMCGACPFPSSLLG